MHIELRPIDSILPYDKNPRLNDAAVEAVARSLKEFGFRQPIVVDSDNIIVVGHTRWKAAKSLGMTAVPVHMAHEFTPEQARAYRIADNQTASIAEWDMTLLPIELAELKDLGIDMALLGWDADELREMMAPQGNAGLIDPDEVPPLPDAAITQPGDLWILGEHRLLCGDSSKPEDLDKLLAGAPIHLVNTDPPYNVKVEPRSNNALAHGGAGLPHPDQTRRIASGEIKAKTIRPKDRKLENDFVTDEAFDGMLDAWFGNASRVLLPGRGFYVWGGSTNCGNYPGFLKKHDLYFHQAVIWVKGHPALTRRDFMSNHEWCFYGWKAGAAHEFFGPSNAVDTWEVKKVSPQAMIHLTEKPVELAARAMAYSSRAGENVLDLFGGSGSTLIAAEQQGRRAYLMELDALYADVILQRFEKFSGKEAVLERTGETFSARRGARAAA